MVVLSVVENEPLSFYFYFGLVLSLGMSWFGDIVVCDIIMNENAYWCNGST